MTKDEALDLALEALEILKRAFFKSASTPEEIEQGCDKGYEDYEAEWVEPALKAITAIKQARSAPVQEPVAEVGEDMKGGGYVKWLSEDFFVPGTKLYTTPPAAPVHHPAFAFRECEDSQAGSTPPAAQPAPTVQIEHCIWARNGNTPCPHTTAQPAHVQEPVAYEYGEEVYWHTNPALNDYIRANGKELVYATPPAAPVQNAKWKAKQKSLAAQAIKCATEAIKDADGPIKAVREYYGAQPAPVQEPVYHLRQFGDVTKEQLDRYMATGDINPQPAPAQEPVMLEMDGKQLTLGEALDEAIAATERSASKRLNAVLVAAKNALYTTPPAAQRQWVELTDDEIGALDYSGTRAEFVKAIEAKLKDKNG